jgi:hypothetical protein
MGIWDTLLPASRSAQQAGFLAPDDIRDARRMALLQAGAGVLASRGGDAMQALGEGIQQGLGGYQNALGSAMRLRMASSLMERQEAAARQRQATYARFQPQPGESREASLARYREMLNAAIQLGDTETVSRLSEYLKSADNASAQSAQRPSLQRIVGPDGKPQLAYVSPEGVQPVEGARPYEAEGSAPAGRMFTGENPATGLPEIGMIDPRTNRVTWTGVRPGSKREGAPTEAELKAGFLFRQSRPFVEQLDQLMRVPNRFETLATRLGANEVLDAERQQMNQAALVVARAKLRLESGAAITEDEARQEMRAMLPQPGDVPAVVRQKKLYLQSVVNAMRQYAQRALSAPENSAPSYTTPSPELGGDATGNVLDQF